MTKKSLGNTNNSFSKKDHKKVLDSSRIRNRRWVMTQHNWTYADAIRIEDTFDKYACGFEVCPTTGNKHLQVYGSFTNARSLDSIKKLFPKAHIEVAKGTEEQNRKYCMKENNPASFTNIEPPNVVYEQLTNLQKMQYVVLKHVFGYKDPKDWVNFKEGTNNDTPDCL